MITWKTINNPNKKRSKSPITICDTCVSMGLGFCRLTLSKKELDFVEAEFKIANEKKAAQLAAQLKEQRRRAFVMQNLDIANLTPLHVSGWENKHFIKPLQTAYEAFHQQDYETAILNYRAVLAQNPMNKAAHLGLAIALYFTHKYEGALNAMLDYSDLFNDGLFFEEIRFIVHLRNRLKDESEYFSFSMEEIENEFLPETMIKDEKENTIVKSSSVADSEKMQMQLV